MDYQESNMTQRIIWVLWPAFIVAGIGTGVFFTAVDPEDIRVFGGALEWSRTALYSVGFLVLWAFAAASSALTVFLQRSPFEINRSPLPMDAADAAAKQEQSGGYSQ
jgi:hypothetical protein